MQLPSCGFLLLASGISNTSITVSGIARSTKSVICLMLYELFYNANRNTRFAAIPLPRVAENDSNEPTEERFVAKNSIGN